jgi:hypothetical protein
MPKYHFDVTDGDFMPDLEGIELADVEAARSHAVGLCGKLLNSDLAKFWQGEEWLIEVRDDSGIVMFTLVFMARDTPVARSQRAAKILTIP